MMLSSSTLGLTPIVGGDQVAVQYFVRVQGEIIAEYEYKLEGVDATTCMRRNKRNWMMKTSSLLPLPCKSSWPT
ncbi:hypothetical protein [Microbulbifer hydrolyticus]|uniref:Uncharacterized protein n=1 Tax=Microbulbifer hydrolyticus TaxID=48074 RepID=A0A6P1TA40_9GAMM|nr:hypothetical protein [Microbulbifer hydrolyticus]MBB5211961.1 hypothetical protein [Microbulbifer hydrolyticus]QHQ39648.1 hypothetical protein GTQ55_12060 [Microbulbifer hydrolyticus]